MIKILIISGEPSGDFLGASLINALKKQVKIESSREISFQGIGGPLMENEGFISLIQQERINKMGLVEIVFNLFDLLKVLRTVSNYCLAWKPDLVVTIDSPEFSFRLSKRVKKVLKATPVVHYVMPSIWAWRPRRLEKIRNFVDHILALFPFEPKLAEINKISCEFVGHPVVSKRIPAVQDIVVLRKRLGIANNVPIMAVMPGSRRSEIKYNLPIFLDTIKIVAAVYTDLVFVIPAVFEVQELVVSKVSKFCEKTGLNILVLNQKSCDIYNDFENLKFSLFRTAAIALATSGTVVLELARAGVPMVVGYRAHYINELVIKAFVKTEKANLIDIIANSNEIPEFIFSNCTSENLSKAIKGLLNDSTLTAKQLELSRKVMKSLGFGGANPGDRAAESVIKFVKNYEKKLPFI